MLANQNLSWKVFLIFWVVANIVAAVLSWVLIISKFHAGVPGESLASQLTYSFISILGVGAILGTMQWIVLRLKISRVSWWILITTCSAVLATLFLVVGNVFPSAAFDISLLGSFIDIFIIGITIGAMQSLILRRELAYSGWWMVANVVGAILAFLAFRLRFLIPIEGTGTESIALIGSSAMFGISTGIVLIWLLYFPPSQKNV